MSWDGNINSPHTMQDEYELARELGVDKLTTDEDGQMVPVEVRKVGAELVWIESYGGNEWHGQLINETDARDRQTGAGPGLKRRRDYKAVIVGPLTGIRTGYTLITQGKHPSSRRYSTHADLSTAQAFGIAWARRRFYVEVES